jgi:hypothetical protein
MNWKRGLIRLWLIATIIWISVVIYVERPDQRHSRLVPPGDLPAEFSADAERQRAALWREQREQIARIAIQAFVPPLLMLGFGFAGMWVYRGFKIS